MSRFFNPENPVFRFLSGIFDMILLNVIFILTSLPLFTVGASLTALYSVLLWRENDNGYLHQIYFSSFRKNFRQATAVWIPCFAVTLFLSYELYLVFRVLDPFWRFLQFPIWISLFLAVSILLYAFPQIARFEQKTLLILKNSILISISNIVLTIAVLAVSFFAVDLCLHNGDWLVLIFSIYLFIGFALTGKVYSFYLRSVFRKIEEGEQKRS